MRLCMFHPNDRPMERGWVGRIDGDRVLHLAAQTLQSLFLGGGAAREHAEYRLGDVTLLPPVLYPPSVRIFDTPERFEFANPAAVVGPGADVAWPAGALALDARVRTAAIVGAGEMIGGFTALGELRARGLEPPKDRDFALLLGPVVVTPDEFEPDGDFRWGAALACAAANTTLRAGDVIAGPPTDVHDIGSPGHVELAAPGIGALAFHIAPR